MNRVTVKPGRYCIRKRRMHQACMALIATLLLLQPGCARFRLPAIDPTGNRLFLPHPYATTMAAPLSPNLNPLRGVAVGAQPPPVVSFPSPAPPTLVAQNPFAIPGDQPGSAPRMAPSPFPTVPAFQHPPDPPPCDPALAKNNCGKKHVIPYPRKPTSNAARGQIITTPARIVAPVGSEVVVLAGICSPNGRFAINQPLEFMLSNDSVGQLIEIGGTQHKTFNQLIGPTARKFDGQYAWGRTGMKERLLTRGTPTPADDITMLKGQTFVSVSSASPGTSYLTSVAPKAAGWDKRKQTTLIHWVDGNWSIPAPSIATSGTVHPLTTRVTSATGDGGVEGWRVKYSIVGGAPAEFAPAGSQTAEAVTGPDGMATVQIRQPAGQFDPGTSQVRVDVIRPRQYGESELVVESGITTVTWSAPALTIRAIGPRSAAIDRPFNYRIEVTNPGDQVARGVVVATRDLNSDVEFISSTPKPTEYGNQFQWDLGDISPGAPPRVIDIQLKSGKRGNVALCFDVASQTDGLQTEACAQTEIATPCIGLDVDGPTTAIVGEQIDFDLIISNQCNESLRDLVLDVTIDTGLRGPEQGSRMQNSIESLAFGQTEEIQLSFIPQQPGRHCFNLSIADEDGNNSQSKICVDVTRAAAGGGQDPGGGLASPIELAVTGQPQFQNGGSGLVRAVVRNTSNRAIDNVILTNRFSPSLSPISVTDSYSQYWMGPDLVFTIGRLEPGEDALVEVLFEAIQDDEQAFLEATVTTPDDVSTTKRFDINIAPASPGQPEPGIGIPGDTVPGGQLPQGRDDPNGQGQVPGNGRGNGEPPRGNVPGEGGIRIPADNLGQGSLRIDVRALNKNVRVGDEADVEFTVTNARQSTDEAIDISMLIPPSLKLVAFDDSQFGLEIKNPNVDATQFFFETRNQMRAGESIKFIARVKAIQAGTSTFEVQAKSNNTVGTTTALDTIFVQ